MMQQQQSPAINFDYLRPPQAALPSIKHEKDYIKKNKRSKSQRRIWENVPYDDYEQEKMADLLKELQKNNVTLPSYWRASDTLKMCYISKFKVKNYLKNVKNHILWRENPIYHNPTEINVAFLVQDHYHILQQKGIIYTVGRDKQYRPVIVMNLELINLKQFPEDVYIGALSFFLDLIKTQCFVPGVIENWIFIMDTKKLGLTQFPFKALNTAISTMQTNFCGCLEKLYMLNPSSSLSFSWKMISSMGDPDSIQKISFLKPKEYTKMQEKIPLNQLEQQYGGTVANLIRFWPPINLEITGGYPEDVLKAADSMQVAKIEIQKEVPVSEEDEAKLAAQMKDLKIPAQEEDDDEKD